MVLPEGLHRINYSLRKAPPPFTDAVIVDHFGKPHLCGFAARMLILAAPSFRGLPREGYSPKR